MTWTFAKAQLSPVFQLLAAPSIAGRNVRETRKIAIRAIRGDTRYAVGVKGLAMYEVKAGLNHTVDGSEIRRKNWLRLVVCPTLFTAF